MTCAEDGVSAELTGPDDDFSYGLEATSGAPHDP